MWRVVLGERVVGFFKKRGLAGELERWRCELEENLRSDPQAVHRLLRERKIGEAVVAGTRVPVRRYRVVLGNVWWRLVFVVDVSACEVVFFDVEKRDEETYKRLCRRL